ncbi:glycerol-3-phosphate 1-O-acyltransferase [bacterium]|nr:MAG: glycerol-3-phosphate 1-O-acyltransferase [bacterium]
MALIFGILLSYLIGSIPTAYLLGKLTKGIDIRQHGSGNVGATNAFRVLGAPIGITVLILDVLKGVVCVIFIADLILRQRVTIDSLFLRAILGAVAVLGHSLTLFLKFKGGKGMATTLGVMIGLSVKSPAIGIILMIEVLIWGALFAMSRIVSLSSIVSAAFFPLLFIIFKQPLPLVLIGLILSIFVIFRHKSNIYRLLRNQEPRLISRPKA